MTATDELTLAERTILANQFRIRAKLEDDPHLEKLAEILERGFKGLYGQVFESIGDPVDAGVIEEVQDIFQMYRALDAAYRDGLREPKDAFYPRFGGFDGTHDPHYGIGKFLVEDLRLFSELKDCPMNSHAMVLPTYRDMLDVWKKIGKPHKLTQAQVDEIAIGPASASSTMHGSGP